MRPLALLCVALLAGCGSYTPESDGYYAPDPGTSNGPAGTGKIGILWTLNSAPPTAESCANVAQLILTLDYGNGRVTISPIPCSAGRLRYDRLPEGAANIILEGYDAQRCRTHLGVAKNVEITATVPDPFSPTIALLPKSCR